MKIEDENGGGREARDADQALGQDKALTHDFEVVTLETNGLADVLDEGSAFCFVDLLAFVGSPPLMDSVPRHHYARPGQNPGVYNQCAFPSL
jgi:hypothetical protein